MKKSKVLNLKLLGSEFIGKCPAHKNGEVNINLKYDHAHCFSCGYHAYSVKEYLIDIYNFYKRSET